MSPTGRNLSQTRASRHATAFAALGDETRLNLLTKLARGRHSISHLARGSKLTRQAVRKHLRVLENAGMIHGVKTGRENLFELRAQPIAGLADYLESISRQWDAALSRLKFFVER